MIDTILISVPVNLANNSPQCTDACIEIVDYMEEYINETKESEDFIMAVVHLKEFNGFVDFFMNCIGTKRRGEYRAALNAGYYTKVLSVAERNQRRDELFAINTSTTERQGEMSEEYFKYPTEACEYICPYHFQKFYGVFTPDNKWIGYISPRFCGEAVATYRILGHAAYLGKINFMLLLMLNVIKDIYEHHPNVHFLDYHLMYVGKQGLQDWKKNVGFKPTRFVGGVNI